MYMYIRPVARIFEGEFNKLVMQHGFAGGVKIWSGILLSLFSRNPLLIVIIQLKSQLFKKGFIQNPRPKGVYIANQ